MNPYDTASRHRRDPVNPVSTAEQLEEATRLLGKTTFVLVEDIENTGTRAALAALAGPHTYTGAY